MMFAADKTKGIILSYRLSVISNVYYIPHIFHGMCLTVANYIFLKHFGQLSVSLSQLNGYPCPGSTRF